MRINVRPLPFVLAYAARPGARRRLARSSSAPDPGCRSTGGLPGRPGELGLPGSTAPPSPLIYAVDDLPGITELYRAVLSARGYSVRTFNDRAVALSR